MQCLPRLQSVNIVVNLTLLISYFNSIIHLKHSNAIKCNLLISNIIYDTNITLIPTVFICDIH